MGTVATLMRPPGDPFHERLVAAFPQIQRFLPRLLDALTFAGIDSARPVLDAVHALGEWLEEKPRTTRRPADEVPLDVLTASWRPYVHDHATDTVDRAGYACCVLDQLRTRLRRRDVYAPGSTRWGDPRAELLTEDVWGAGRDAYYEDLALEPDPDSLVGQLSDTLDAAWRRTAAGYAANPDLRVEHRHGRDELVLSPLDAQPEPASLVALRDEIDKLLPEVEIADLPLEVHAWTGFLNEYTHISGQDVREPGLPETLSALLVSESCNVGLTPVADEIYPPLTRARLNWVGHNYFRSATHTAPPTPASSTSTAPAVGPGLGRRGHGLGRRDAVRHPRRDHQRRLQPALLRPPARLHAVLLDRRHVHRFRAEADPRHPTRQPARARRAAGQRHQHPTRHGLHRHRRHLRSCLRPGLVPGLPVGTPTGRPTRPTALAHRPPRRLRPTRHARPSPHQHPAHQRKLGRDLPVDGLPARRHRHPLGDPAHPAARPQPLQPRPP